jgi:hypothetical protein
MKKMRVYLYIKNRIENTGRRITWTIDSLDKIQAIKMFNIESVF